MNKTEETENKTEKTNSKDSKFVDVDKLSFDHIKQKIAVAAKNIIMKKEEEMRKNNPNEKLRLQGNVNEISIDAKVNNIIKEK